jgi:hypothetical protein
VGALITIALAKAEGWMSKNGSKWKTMPEQMLMYRAAAFWTRAYAPELSLGMQTAEEVADTHGIDVREVPNAITPGDSKALEAELLGRDTSKMPMPEHTPDGEVVEAEPAKAAGRGRAAKPAPPPKPPQDLTGDPEPDFASRERQPGEDG